MITLYHGLASTCSKKVRLALFEKGLDFESRLLNLQAFEQHDPEYLKLNPGGVVPTLVHDGRPVTESTLIIEYIDEVWPQPALSPADPYERARMRLWTKWSDEHAYKAVYVPTWDRLSRPVAQGLSDDELAERLARIPTAERRARWQATAREGFSEAEFAAAYAEMHLTFSRMDEALGANGPWLMGEMYTLADIALVPFVDRITDLKPELLDGGAYPALGDWLARYRQRPAYDKAFFFEGRDASVGAIEKALGIA
ncbi:MAG: glutathione S-transferase family protein [Alphaproteobacteria bacterium]|nr:glutathione S-transferase family protein [Alphaproteobacteria bacterium]